MRHPAQSGFALITVVIFLTIVAFAFLTIGEQNSGLSTSTKQAADDATLAYVVQAASAHAKFELATKGCANYNNLSNNLGSSDYQIDFLTTSGSPISYTLISNLSSGLTNTQTQNSTKSYGSTTLTSLAISKSTYIDEGLATINSGNATDLQVTEAATHDLRILIQGALDSIPAEARIDKAEIILKIIKPQTNYPIKIQRLTQDWDEDQVTWLLRRTGENWTTPGGTVANTDYGSLTANAAVDADMTVDVTAIVRDWQNGVANNGMLLTFDTTSSADAKFHSDDSSGITLNIYHSCECGQTCAIDNTMSCDAEFRPNTQRISLTPTSESHTGVTGVPENAKLMGITIPAGGGVITATDDTLYATDMASNPLGACTPSLQGEDLSGLTYVTGGDYAGTLGLITVAVPPTLFFVGADCSVVSSQVIRDASTEEATGITYLSLAANSKHENYFAFSDENGNVAMVSPDFKVTETISPATIIEETTGIVHIPNKERFLISGDVTQEIATLSFDGTILDRYDFTRFGLEGNGGMSLNATTCDHLLANLDDKVVKGIYNTPLSKQPIAHWKLDETSGSIAVDSISGHNGANANNPTWEDTGVVQGALRLDGFSQQSSVADDPALRMTNEVTVAGWILPDSTNNHHVLISKGPATEQNYWIGIGGGSFTMIYHDGAYNQVFAPTPILFPDQWYHLAYSYSTVSGLLNMYLDGILVHTEPSGGSLTTSSEPLLLGSSWSGGYAHGLIDDIYLFDAELTADDIKLLFDEGLQTDLSTNMSAPSQSPLECSKVSLADDFESNDFSGDTGTLSWSSDWEERGETDGPLSGDIRILPLLDGHAIRLRDNQNGGEGISRTVDLSKFTDAILTIEYARFAMHSPNFISIRLLDDAAQAVEIGRIEEIDGVSDDDTANFVVATFDLNAYVGEINELTFITSAGMPNNSGAYIDNIEIQGCTP